MNQKIEPLPRHILENMIAAGQIYWRKPPLLIPRKWVWPIIAGIPAIIIIAVVAYPS